MPDDYTLTTAQVATILGVTPSMVRYLRTKDRLDARLVRAPGGGPWQWRFNAEDVEGYKRRRDNRGREE